MTPGVCMGIYRRLHSTMWYAFTQGQLFVCVFCVCVCVCVCVLFCIHYPWSFLCLLWLHSVIPPCMELLSVFSLLPTDIDECIDTQLDYNQLNYTQLQFNDTIRNDTQRNDTRLCEQICTNTIGSYNCSCSSEYSLADDLHNCLGMCHCVRHTLHCVDHHIKPFCL